VSGFRKAGRAGRTPRLRAEDLPKIERGLQRGPDVRNRFVDGVAGGVPDRGAMWGSLPCLAGFGAFCGSWDGAVGVPPGGR
jgi:hypothetical protein